MSKRTYLHLALPLLLGAGVLGSSMAQPAAAHFTRSNYAYTTSTCTKRVDPVTVVFRGPAAGALNVNLDTFYHTGWWNSTGEGDQWIHDHGGCNINANARASDCGQCTRFHARYWNKVHKDEQGRRVTVATPHHEDWVKWSPANPRCTNSHLPGSGKHAVDKGTVDNPTKNGSGFDVGRKRLAAEFGKSRYHRVTDRSYWRNTDSFKQCDDDLAGSNGWVTFLSFAPHPH